MRLPPGEKAAAGGLPFQNELLSERGDGVVTAIQKMTLLSQLGMRAALLTLRVEKCDAKKPAIHILPCKPSCWRLYFHADQEAKRFVFLLAKCKKKWKRDPEDCRKARRLLERLEGGTVDRALFPFPNRGALQ